MKQQFLNFKYEIFPTDPQRKKINNLLFQSSIQWNRSVSTFLKLQKAINLGQYEYVVSKIIDRKKGKNNNHGKRKGHIEKLQEQFPDTSVEQAGILYDVGRMFGLFIEELTPEFSNPVFLAAHLKNFHIEGNEKVKWKLSDCCKEISGEIGNRYIAFPSNKKKVSLSEMRNNVTGSKDSKRWKTATKPTREQRTYGAKGFPNFKSARKWNSIDYPPKKKLSELVRKRKKGKEYLANIRVLPEGMREVKMAYHRPMSDGKIKNINVQRDGKHYFCTFCVAVNEKDWQLPLKKGLIAGIDPGADTPVTVGQLDINKKMKSNFSLNYEFFEKNRLRLEKLQQALSGKQGLYRNKIELKKAIKEFEFFLGDIESEDKKKKVQKRLNYLQKQKIRTKPSKAWLKLNYEIKELHYRIKCQRKDILEKISHYLATNCELISFGHWEPPREISYRKKLKELQKNLRMGEPGAKKALEEHEKMKSKNANKGIKKVRRGGRDRSIATMRAKIESKCERSGSLFIRQNEAYSTVTCHVCRKKTGPKQDLSVRKWICENCKTEHNRDENSSYEILNKSLDNILAVQAMSSAVSANSKSKIRKQELEVTSQGLISFLGSVPTTAPAGEVFPYYNGTGVKLLSKKEGSLKSLDSMSFISTLEVGECTEFG
ncbi:MAG: transposase [Desulfobacterales bacterium]|nr:transposase [Desulfobacterales bacterium]